MKHLLIALMLASAFAFVVGCTQPAEEDVIDEVVCGECGEVCDCEEAVCDECACETVAEVCEDCGKEECACEVATEICEACGKEECECPAEEVVEEGGE